MSAQDKKEAAERAARAATQAKHATKNIVEAAEIEKDVIVSEVTDLVKANRNALQTPLSIIGAIAVVGGTALAYRGGRDLIADLRTKRAELKVKAAAAKAAVDTAEEATPDA